MVTRRTKWILTALFAALALPACDVIIGIKDAELDPNANQTLCDRYCNAALDTCSGNNGQFAVYASFESCLSVCALLPPGNAGETIGNSVECRLKQLTDGATTGEVDVHCPVGGPAGNNVCGSNCEAYCELFQVACETRFNQLFSGGAQQCLSDCAQIPDIGGFSINDQLGDSIQCRLYHVAAALDSAATHCPHAAGDEKCVPGGDGGGGAGGGGSVGSGGSGGSGGIGSSVGAGGS